MKDRILEIMKRNNMTQQEFAAALEISPATLSNIFNGKTNPTNNHVMAIHKRFPQINVNWLMFGEGNMFTIENMGFENTSSIENDLFADACSDTNTVDNCKHSITDSNGILNPGQLSLLAAKVPEVKERKIIEIRIFYDDGTFETFTR